MSLSSTSLLCCATLAVSLLAGCGGGDPLGRKAISGTVTLDGSPVVGGSINFDPKGGGASTSSGANISAGKFDIKQEVGLPPGTYIVRISVPKPGTGGVFKPGSMPGEMLAPPEEMAPADWNANSQQTIEVKAAGPFEFKFDIQTKKK